MAKKSIADLERYVKFLTQSVYEMQDVCEKNVFNVGEVDQFDMIEEMTNIESIKSVLSILDQEIAIACLSNSIKHNEEELSIYQANEMKWSLIGHKNFLCKLRDNLFKGKSDIDTMRFRQQSVSQEILTEKINSVGRTIYSLEDRIEREKARTIIEIDMNTLMPFSNRLDTSDSAKAEVA